MKCPNCGSDNAPGSRFCYNCGTSLAAAATPPAPSTPDLTKKPSDTPPAQPPVERTVVMSLPPNMFPPPPANVPPASNIPPAQPPAGATQASDFPPYGATQANDVTMPPYSPPPPPASAPASSAGGVKRSGMAVASLLLGILGIPCATIAIIPIVAIVLGFIARGQISKSGGTLTGGGMAIAGIVLGFFGLILAIGTYILLPAMLGSLAALGGA